MGFAQNIILTSIFVGLGACQSTNFQDRYGPSPVIVASDVQVSTANQLLVLTALASSAGLSLPEPEAPEWFAVMEAGLNYVDEKCDAYITDLFIRTREKDRFKGLAVLGDKAAGAILFSTGAAKATMAIVAQSFGFAEGATDLVGNSYLFQISPAHIQYIVADMRKAYRQGAYRKRESIRYPTLAYHYVQKYLELCLPQTIEAKIGDVLARTKAFPDTTSGPSVDVLLGAARPVEQRQAAQNLNLTQSENDVSAPTLSRGKRCTAIENNAHPSAADKEFFTRSCPKF